MQYISQNLAVVLESKVLATVQEDYLLKLTEYYRKNSESVGRRRIPLHSSVVGFIIFYFFRSKFHLGFFLSYGKTYFAPFPKSLSCK